MYTSVAAASGHRLQYTYPPVSDPNQAEQIEMMSRKQAKGNLVRTRTTESDHEEDELLDRKSGYILVDLKGDKVVHIDQDYLIGCEVNWLVRGFYSPFSYDHVIYLDVRSGRWYWLDRRVYQ